MPPSSLRLGISLGDPAGIGPEITLKALARLERGSGRYLIIGDGETLSRAGAQIGASIDLSPEQDRQARYCLAMSEGAIPFATPPTPGTPEAARAALSWLEEGARRCLRGELAGLVTAPVNKASILRAGIPFVGQTEYLSALASTTRTAMMLLGEDDRGRVLRVALATTHLPLRQVADHLETGRLAEIIELTVEACARLNLPRRRVAVCGLNPHAGEGGYLGDEEQRIIGPAVERVRRGGHDVRGPLAADALFYQALRGDYDAVVAMYHDQGLVPLKMIGFERGVNWTLGLPFVRTSPDHGTAYDLAGRGVASEGSMVAAIQLAWRLAGCGPGA